MILWWREQHISVQVRCTQILQKSGRFLQIVGDGRVTRSNFHTYDPQCWSGLWTSLLSDVFCLVRVDWQMLFVCTEKNCNNCTKNIKCLCTQFSCLLPRHLGFAHSWHRWFVNSWNEIQFPSFESENKNTGRGVSLSWRTRLHCGLDSAQASGLTTWGTWPCTAVLSSVCIFTAETLQLPSAREEGYSHQRLTQVIHVCE